MGNFEKLIDDLRSFDPDFDFEQAVSVDESGLDTEWLDQSRKMFVFCKLEAQAQKEVDAAKENLDVVRAELDKKIRDDPDKYEVSKITEAAVSNAILVQPEYKEASQKLNEARYNLNMAKAAVKSIDTKKSALENLVKLHGQKYFAGPSVPRDLSKEWELKKKQQAINKGVTIKPRRKPPNK